jgi:hypothetical protein
VLQDAATVVHSSSDACADNASKRAECIAINKGCHAHLQNFTQVDALRVQQPLLPLLVALQRVVGIHDRRLFFAHEDLAHVADALQGDALQQVVLELDHEQVLLLLVLTFLICMQHAI